MQPADRPPTEAPLDKPVVPAFFDLGEDGTWLEHLQFTPWLIALDGALCNSAFAAALKLDLHDSPNKPGEEYDHVKP